MTTRLEEPEIRVEAWDKVTGVARYTDDREVPGALIVRYLYAGVAHGRIRRMDTRRAEAIDGVEAVFTGRDTTGLRAGRRLQDWPLLAWDRVRFAGERVAAVAAESERAADAALAAIDVDYDELPAVFDPVAALAPGAPILHPDASTYRYLGAGRPPTSHPNIQGELIARKGPTTDEALEAALARRNDRRRGRIHDRAPAPGVHRAARVGGHPGRGRAGPCHHHQQGAVLAPPPARVGARHAGGADRGRQRGDRRRLRGQGPLDRRVPPDPARATRPAARSG